MSGAGVGRVGHTAFALALALAVGVGACGGGLSSAKSAFRRGRLVDAKTELVALEPEAHEWTGRRRAEYALYRGLVHHALGDRSAADVWLKEAKAVEDAHPHTLLGEDRVRLELALEALAAGQAVPPP